MKNNLITKLINFNFSTIVSRDCLNLYLDFINDAIMVVVPAVERLFIGWFNVDPSLRILNLTGVQAFSRGEVDYCLAFLVS